MHSLHADPAFWAGVRDWVIGVGTLGTLLVSVVVLRRQGDEIEAQASERREEAEYRRSAQARQVRLNILSLRGGGTVADRRYETHVPEVELVNESEDAVYDVVLGMSVISNDGDVEAESGSTWDPISTPVLASGKKLTHRIAVKVLWQDARANYARFEIHPHVEFTDQAGQAWRREHDLRLTRVV